MEEARKNSASMGFHPASAGAGGGSGGALAIGAAPVGPRGSAPVRSRLSSAMRAVTGSGSSGLRSPGSSVEDGARWGGSDGGPRGGQGAGACGDRKPPVGSLSRGGSGQWAEGAPAPTAPYRGEDGVRGGLSLQAGGGGERCCELLCSVILVGLFGGFC